MNRLSLFNDFPDKKNITHVGGRGEVFHDWYPYLEGFSYSFVKYIQNKFLKKSKKIIDPFSGVGTTAVALSSLGLECGYCEINPVLRKITEIKIKIISLSKQKKRELSLKLLEISKEIKNKHILFEENKELQNTYVNTFKKSVFFDPLTFSKILKIKTFNNKLSKKNILLSDLLMIAVFSKLIYCSKLKRMGDLRYKNKKELMKKCPEIISEISNQLVKMSIDCERSPSAKIQNVLLSKNSKNLIFKEKYKADGVITSPPYLNGTNYIRNTKLELWYMGLLKDKKDLRDMRNEVITSGINDVGRNAAKTEIDPLIKRIVGKLDKVSYDGRIPLMVSKYFKDMEQTFNGLAHHVKSDGIVCIDIGDSKFCGIHIPTDVLLKKFAEKKYFQHIETIKLRSRFSHDKSKLKQSLIILRRNKKIARAEISKIHNLLPKWENFKKNIPHLDYPFSKRNWGSDLHSLCSFQGKMKPSLAYHLIDTFSKPGDTIFDPFSGSGTISLEASLNGRKSYAIDISNLAHSITSGKIKKPCNIKINKLVRLLENYINRKKLSIKTIKKAKEIKFNKNLEDYFHPKTFQEILKAREFFLNYKKKDHSYHYVLSSLLHILHGNRPYALSRRSHPLTPYAPTGIKVYKNLVKHLRNKILKSTKIELPNQFKEGKSFNFDICSNLPKEIKNIDCIITSPPFFMSTKFYMTNWMRFWFSGWELETFTNQISNFIEKKQIQDFEVYNTIFNNFKKVLKKNALIVMHLGKSNKCDMGKEISKIAKRHFSILDLFNEDVRRTEKHGIRDKGAVVNHQYLILRYI